MRSTLWLRGSVDGIEINEMWEGNNYYEEVAGFVDAVMHNDQSLLRSTYADASRTLSAVEAATRAVTTGIAVDISVRELELAK